MEKAYASNLLKIDPGASDSVVETAYRKAREEVETRLSARDRSTQRRRDERMKLLAEARETLLAKTEDGGIQSKEPQAEVEVPQSESESAQVELKTTSAEIPPVIEPVLLRTEEIQTPIEQVPSPRDHIPPPADDVPARIDDIPTSAKRVPPRTDEMQTPMGPVTPPAEGTPPRIEPVPPPIKRVPPPIKGFSKRMESARQIHEPVSRPDQSSATPDQPALTTSTRKRWLAIVAVILILAAVGVAVFMQLHPSGGSQGSRIAFNTIPHNADVWVDGISRGKTPLVLDHLQPGDRQINIELQGYEPKQLIVSVKPRDEESTLIQELIPASPKRVSQIEVPPAHPEVTTAPLPTTPAIGPTVDTSLYPGERYPQTRERILTEADVANLNFAELQYAINEVYARHGAHSSEIEKQFHTAPWYHPRNEVSQSSIENEFSKIEKQNVDMLAHLRDQKRPK
jgi:hypothetical protein